MNGLVVLPAIIAVVVVPMLVWYRVQGWLEKRGRARGATVTDAQRFRRQHAYLLEGLDRFDADLPQPPREYFERHR
jgi:hypothetical protein